MKGETKQLKRYRRHQRIRSKIFGFPHRPRFSVYRSNRHLVLQLIDDTKGKTILQLNDIKKEIQKEILKKKMKKVEIGYFLGKKFAELALKKGIKKVVFDRGGYKYHGRIKAVAEGAREGGLKF